MKKILLFSLLLIASIGYGQRQVPRGGTYGQVLKVSSDGYSIAWADPVDTAIANAPLFFVDVASTAALPVTYTSGTLTATSNGRIGTIDGVTLTTNSTFLYKNGLVSLQNGIYYLADTGTVSTPYKWVRSTTYDQTAEVYPSQVNVNFGTLYAGKYFLQTSVAPVIGTDPITYISIAPSNFVPYTGANQNVNLNSKDLTNIDSLETTALVLNSYTVTAAGNATVSGVNSGDQTITLNGVVGGSGTGAITTTLCCLSSADLSTALSDETGLGLAVFNTSPTFTTSIITPSIIGGTSTSSKISYISTSGAGTSTLAAHSFLGGTNGSILAMTIFNDGNINIGKSSSHSTIGFRKVQNITGAVSATGALFIDTIMSDVTTSYSGILSAPITTAASFTLTDIYAFTVTNQTPGAGSVVTNYTGYRIPNITMGTNNYGIRSIMTAGANKWFIYGNNDAKSYHLGKFGIGTGKTSPSHQLEVGGGASCDTLFVTDAITFGANQNIIKNIKVSLSSAQIKALFSTPITLIAAPGSGYAIKVISISGRYNYGTTTYVYGGTSLNIYANTATSYQASNYILIPATSSKFQSFEMIGSTSNSTIIDNKALMVACDTSNPTTGDGTIDLYITYEIIKL